MEKIVNKSILRMLVMFGALVPALAQAGFYIEEGVLEPRATQRQEQAEPQKAPVAPVAAPVQAAAEPEAKKETKKPEPPAARPVWVARSGTTLRKTIEEWSRIVDWTVVWEPADLDYPNPATRTFEGSFEEVVKELFKPYEKAKRPLLVDGWRGNTVVIISEKR